MIIRMRLKKGESGVQMRLYPKIWSRQSENLNQHTNTLVTSHLLLYKTAEQPNLVSTFVR